MISPNLLIKEKDKQYLEEMPVTNTDENGKKYNSKIKYLPKSIRVSLEVLIQLYNSNSSAFGVYLAIINKLRKNETIVNIDTNYIKSFLGLSNSSISRGLNTLIDLNIIEVIRPGVYYIPISKSCKGNINKMLELDEENSKEAEKQKAEEEIIKSMCLLNRSLKNKRKK